MRKVLITGASRGIGKAIAEKFKEEGYILVCPTRQEMDLSDPRSVEVYIANHKDEYFDVIVNNAGVNEINEITQIKDDELTQMMQINLISPIRLLRGFVGKMKEKRYGRIVNIGSIWATVSKGGRCVYSATKNGVHGVTNTLAVELAPYNILVNTVCPGFTLTELTYKNNTLRMAEPREMAEVVYFLCSDKNTYLTGQKITIDGGYSEK